MKHPFVRSRYRPTVQDRRKQFFFWLGVFVLPAFWSWFTLSRGFTRRERLIAFVWLAVLAGWLFQGRLMVEEQLQLLAVSYPAVLGWLAVALFVWLLFRLRVVPTLIELILLIDLLAVLASSMLFDDRIGRPFAWTWAAVPVALALAHLALEPLDQWQRNRKSHQALKPR